MIFLLKILTLDDNKKYSVAFSTEYNNKNYVYLIDQEDYTNAVFCEYDDNNGLEEVVDPEIIDQLMIKFKESMNW